MSATANAAYDRFMQTKIHARRMAAVLVALLLSRPLTTAAAQGEAENPSASSAAAANPATPRARKVSPFKQQEMTHKAQQYYLASWGLDKLKLSYTASGNLIRFSYRVADPARAQQLGDKKNTPYLFAPRSSVILQVPVMDKVGMLRQAATAEAGKEYWMVFSNKGNLVRQGDRVNVVIGAFHADGLMVD